MSQSTLFPAVSDCSVLRVVDVQLVSNSAVLVCANVVGLHQRTMTVRRHRRTFNHIRSYIELRVKLENERQQQVRQSAAFYCEAHTVSAIFSPISAFFVS